MQTRTCQTYSPLHISMRTRDMAIRIKHRVHENPSFIPMCFGTQQKVRKWQKLHFTLFTCRYHNSQNIPNNLILEYQHTTPVECCSALFPMQSTQTASLDNCKSPCVSIFDCCFIQQFHFTTPLAKLTRSPEKSYF